MMVQRAYEFERLIENETDEERGAVVKLQAL